LIFWSKSLKILWIQIRGIRIIGEQCELRIQKYENCVRDPKWAKISPPNSQWLQSYMDLKLANQIWKFWKFSKFSKFSKFRNFRDFENVRDLKMFEILKIFEIFPEIFQNVDFFQKYFLEKSFFKIIFRNYFSPWWKNILHPDFFYVQIYVSRVPENDLGHSTVRHWTFPDTLSVLMQKNCFFTPFSKSRTSSPDALLSGLNQLEWILKI